MNVVTYVNFNGFKWLILTTSMTHLHLSGVCITDPR